MTFSLLTIFGAGLLTFASPCVLPLMPIYLATLAGSALGDAGPQRTRRTVAVALAFTAGLSVVFVLLGALATTLGRLLTEQRTTIVLVSGGLMVLFGLRSLRLLRVSLLDRDTRPLLEGVRTTSTLFGAFAFGAAFALGWSPCIGPVLASVLGYAATHTDDPLRGAAYLAVYAAGLSTPLLLLAAGAARAGGWLKRFRSAIPRLEKVTGAALLALGLWTVFDALPLASRAPEVATNTTPMDAAHEAASTCSGAEHLCGLPAQTALPLQAPDLDRPAGARLLEFTARECPVCRRMRPIVERVEAACTTLEARIVRVDVATPEGRALADHHHVRGTPTFVLIDGNGVERERLLGETSANEVAAAVERAFGVSCSLSG